MPIKRVGAGTECRIGEAKCGFRLGSACIDRAVAVRQVCEKYLMNGERCIWAIMDLETDCDTINQYWYCGSC